LARLRAREGRSPGEFQEFKASALGRSPQIKASGIEAGWRRPHCGSVYESPAPEADANSISVDCATLPRIPNGDHRRHEITLRRRHISARKKLESHRVVPSKEHRFAPMAMSRASASLSTKVYRHTFGEARVVRTQLSGSVYQGLNIRHFDEHLVRERGFRVGLGEDAVAPAARPNRCGLWSRISSAVTDLFIVKLGAPRILTGHSGFSRGLASNGEECSARPSQLISGRKHKIGKIAIL
jgi:hypothetical protein